MDPGPSRFEEAASLLLKAQTESNSNVQLSVIHHHMI